MKNIKRLAMAGTWLAAFATSGCVYSPQIPTVNERVAASRIWKEDMTKVAATWDGNGPATPGVGPTAEERTLLEGPQRAHYLRDYNRSAEDFCRNLRSQAKSAMWTHGGIGIALSLAGAVGASAFTVGVGQDVRGEYKIASGLGLGASLGVVALGVYFLTVAGGSRTAYADANGALGLMTSGRGKPADPSAIQKERIAAEKSALANDPLITPAKLADVGDKAAAAAAAAVADGEKKNWELCIGASTKWGGSMGAALPSAAAKSW